VWQDARLFPGIARDASGGPMASPELVTVVNLASVDSPGGMNVTVRGLSRDGIEMRPVSLAVGRWFEPGRREIMVGRSIARRYAGARPGDRIRFGRGDWDVVGVMDAGESAVNSEIWADLGQIGDDFNRNDAVNSLLVRAADPGAVSSLI